MTKKWYVLRSKPNKEFFLAEQLKQWNCDVYFPVIKIKPINPRCRTLVPFFPGYIFIHTDIEQTTHVVFERIPGSIGLVYLGGEISTVPEKILQQIQMRIEELDNSKNNSIFNKGEKISISSGIFTGYEAIFNLQIPGTDRAKALITMISGNQIKIELSVNEIIKQS